MLFDGYSGLMSQQSSISKNSKNYDFPTLLNGEAIAESSIRFGEKTVDPFLLKEFSKLKFSGTICDLGCVLCTRLSKICKLTNHPGLGFDNIPEVIEDAINASVDDKLISCECHDIKKLEGIWEDVVVLMQCFVFHDFVPEIRCKGVIDSYLNNFPNLKNFFYVDIVAPSQSQQDMMPGFDYVHGLMKIKTRTYEETIQMFKDSRFEVTKETPIRGLPNTFLWILSPKM